MSIYDLFHRVSDNADNLAIIEWDRTVTWRQMVTHIETQTDRLRRLQKKRVGFRFSPTGDGFAVLAALDRLECEVFLLDDQLAAAELGKLAGEFGIGATVGVSDTLDPENGQIRWLGETDAQPVAAGVTLLTSGTEGRPKAVRHTWASLSRPVRKTSSGIGQRWLLAFRPHLYAGLQVILQCFANQGTLVSPRQAATPDEIAAMIVDQKVQCVSATPSYWRRLCLFSDSELLVGNVVRQITLGGEIVDQHILDALRDRFPSARIAHIYATTELGRCFSVTDGLAGFPRFYLDGPTMDGIELAIRDGVLWVRSPNAMVGYRDTASATADKIVGDKDGWYPTGDQVESQDERVVFVGRRGDMINVGGGKVQPVVVENVIRQVAGVADVCVFGQSSSIAGELVACQIVVTEGHDPKTVRRAIITHCSAQLASSQRPRLIDFTDRIELTNAGKVARRNRQTS